MAKKPVAEPGSSLAYFKQMVKEIADPDTHFVSDGTSSAEFIGGTDTGSYILNAALSGSLFGGAPNNKVIGWAGDPATGKTFFVMGIAKRWLDDHKDGFLFYYDTEAAVTKSMMSDRGIDTSRVIIVEPETIQKFRHHALKVIDNYKKTKESDRPPMLMILDSLGMLSSTKEIEDTNEGKDTKDMTKPGIIKATFRVLGLKLAKIGVNLHVTNHVYAVIGCLGKNAIISRPLNVMTPITDIKVGDLVSTLDGDKPVIELYQYDVDDVFDITFDDGVTITATPNHKFLTVSRGWQRADSLTESDELCILQK